MAGIDMLKDVADGIQQELESDYGWCIGMNIANEVLTVLNTNGGVLAMLCLCEDTLRQRELDEPRGAKREYLRTARENTLRALRAVSKAMECEGGDNGGN